MKKPFSSLRGSLAFGFLLLCSFAGAQSNWQLLWRISGDSAAGTSYLLGTIHISDARVFDFPDSVLAALLACDRFAMEVLPDSTAAAAQRKARNGESAPLLSDLLPAEAYKKFRQRFQKEFDIDLNRYHADDLYQLRLGALDLEFPASDMPTFMDAWLMQRARSWGKAVQGLENVPPDTYVAAEVAEDLERILARNDGRQGLENLVQVYLRGDLRNMDEIISLSGYQDPAEYNRSIRVRNRQMGDSLIRLMKRERIFAAVGSAHLPGPDGLIERLRDAGYRVEAVPATKTGWRDSLLKQTPPQPIPWIRHLHPDEIFNVDFPVAPTASPAPFDSSLRQYFAFDQGLGMYFRAVALRVRRDRLETALDTTAGSLVSWYSHKGAVRVSDKPITYQQLRGREIVVREKNNGRQWETTYRIFLSDRWISLFAASRPLRAPDEVPAELERFFRSVYVKPPPESGWTWIDSDRHRFEVLMPVNHKQSARVQYSGKDSVPQRIVQWSGTEPESKNFYSLEVVSFLSDQFVSNDSITLRAWFMRMANNLEKRFGARLTRVSPLRVEGYPAYDVRMGTGSGEEIRGLYILRGSRVYIVFCVHSSNPEEVEEFFSSFRMLPFQPSPLRPFYPADSAFQLMSLPEAPLIAERRGEEAEIGAEIWDNWQYKWLDSANALSFVLVRHRVSPYYDTPPDSLLRTRARSVLQVFEADSSSVQEEPFDGGGEEGRFYRANMQHSHQELSFTVLSKGNETFMLICVHPPDATLRATGAHFVKSIHISKLKPEFDMSTDLGDRIFEGLRAPQRWRRNQAREGLFDYSFTLADTARLAEAALLEYPQDSTGRSTLGILVDELVESGAEQVARRILLQKYDSYAAQPRTQMELLTTLADIGSEAAIEDLRSRFLPRPPAADFGKYLFQRLSRNPHSLQFLPDVLSLLEFSEWQRPVLSWALSLQDTGWVMLDTLPQASEQILRLNRSRLDKCRADEDSVVGIESLLISALAYLPQHPEAEPLLRQWMSLEDPYVDYAVLRALLRLNLPFSTADLMEMAASDAYRIDLYDALQGVGLLSRFPKEYRKQEHLAATRFWNFLYAEHDIRSKKIEVLDRISANIQGQQGYLYVLRVSLDLNGNGVTQSYAALSGLYAKPKDLEMLEERHVINSRPYESPEELQAKIESMLRSLNED